MGKWMAETVRDERLSNMKSILWWWLCANLFIFTRFYIHIARIYKGRMNIEQGFAGWTREG